MDKIICVAGPTASGKTRLAVALAKALDGEVISCDSMQVYRRMDVGTAKPTKEERQGVPHHMIDVAEPWEDFSVGKYVAMADPILQDVLARGKTAVIAGGTGLYMDALIRGNAFAPIPRRGRRQELEERARKEGIESLLRELERVDPASARRLHPGDEKRIIRAMEVYLETGRSITAHNEETKKRPPRYEALYLGLDFEDRQALYRRIDRRVEEMVAAGLREEVERLHREGIPAEATALQAIGYKEPMEALRGEITWQEAVEKIQQSSRRYAKRQLTWFRRNEKMNWLYQKENQNFSEVFAWAAQVIPFFDREKW